MSTKVSERIIGQLNDSIKIKHDLINNLKKQIKLNGKNTTQIQWKESKEKEIKELDDLINTYNHLRGIFSGKSDEHIKTLTQSYKWVNPKGMMK